METRAVEIIKGIAVIYTDTGKNEIDFNNGIETFEENLSEEEKERIRKKAAPLIEGTKLFLESVAERYGKTIEETRKLINSKNIEDFRGAFEDKKQALEEFCWVQSIGDPAGFYYEPHKEGIAVRVGGRGGRIQWIADENLQLHTKYVYFADGEIKKETMK